MSESSDESVYGDGDQNLLLDDEEDIDFYAILNVTKDSTEDEIVKAYKRRCLIFHPDRHPNEDDKKEAEKIFVQLRRAYETLIDPRKKAIYDALGVAGLETQGWQLVSRSVNPENIRKEYEFLQRLKENELMLQRVHPSGGFVVRSSLAGLLVTEPEDRYGPQLLGVAITQSVDCAMTGSDRIGLTGRVKAGNGRGDGNVDVHWRRNMPNYNVESHLAFASDSMTTSVRLSKSVFTRAAIVIQPSLQYFPFQGAIVPSFMCLFSMRLRLRLQGSIVLNASPLQSSLTTTLMYTENNQPKAYANFTISPSSPSIRLVHIRRRAEKDSFLETAFQMSPFGFSPSVVYERRLSRFSRIGCAVSFQFPACLLTARFKVKTGLSIYEWHLVLCDDKDELVRSAVLGVVVPFCVFHVARAIFRPWFDKIGSFFDDRSQEREVDILKKEEAARVVNLMRTTADRIKREEADKGGIIIDEARYGECESGGVRGYAVAGGRTIDVTVPLQAMVNDSQLRIYSLKSQIPGFYDPCPGEAKMLRVKYTFRGEPHSVTVSDEMPLTLPLRAHRVFVDGSGDASSIHRTVTA